MRGRTPPLDSAQFRTKSSGNSGTVKRLSVLSGNHLCIPLEEISGGPGHFFFSFKDDSESGSSLVVSTGQHRTSNLFPSAAVKQWPLGALIPWLVTSRSCGYSPPLGWEVRRAPCCGRFVDVYSAIMLLQACPCVRNNTAGCSGCILFLLWDPAVIFSCLSLYI